MTTWISTPIRTTTSKIQRDDKLLPDEHMSRLTEHITYRTSAKNAVSHLIDESTGDIIDSATKEVDLNFSLSDAKYSDIAPFIGLDPFQKLADISTYELHRSRIPTALFHEIVKDIKRNMLITRYNSPGGHPIVLAVALVLNPIFNHLFPLFDGYIRNTPQSFSDCTTPIDKVVSYFRAFNVPIAPIVMMFVEARRTARNYEGRVDIITKVIAECIACHWNNSRINFSIPIHAILFDGYTYQFFIFDGRTKPYTFSMGLVPGSAFSIWEGLPLGDLLSNPTGYPWPAILRPICDTIFNVFLVVYCASSRAFRDELEWSEQERERWDKTIEYGKDASHMFQDAEVKRRGNLIIEADEAVEKAFNALNLSLDAVPIAGQKKIAAWDEDEVMRLIRET